MAVLYFTPTTVSVMEDEQFETTLRLSNPGGQTFDRLNVELLYNAAAIEPLGYQAEQAGRSAERIDLKTNAETGRMGLEMVFSRERQDQLASLVTIQWRARREVRATQVVFLSRDEARTFVGLPAGGSILGNTERDAPGVIQTSVRVAPNFSLTPVEGSSALPYVDLGQSAVAPIGGVNLTLRPRQSTASVNGLVDVDVVVSNPDSARVDSIRLFIRFDPDALQVLDTHSGNWIERDINIWDGHAHEMFPWDIHIANEANNSLGRITYAMGLVEEMPLPSGVLATIRFRVKSPAGSLPIAFDPERTSVRLLGEDQLGDPLAEGDGLRDTVVEVRDPSHDLPVVTGARRGPPIS
jgi:hypothetical protein